MLIWNGKARHGAVAIAAMIEIGRDVDAKTIAAHGHDCIRVGSLAKGDRAFPTSDCPNGPCLHSDCG
jgi:hypothetical protein